MKKYFSMLLAVLLLCGMMSVAQADTLTLENALPSISNTQFEKYASYTCDTMTGEWSVHANEADAALAQFATSAPGYTGGIAYFYLELTGNARTGMVVPVLNIYYMGYNDAKSDAVSFCVDGVRYDFPVVTEETELADYDCERIRVFLNEEGLQMLRAMQDAEDVKVRLHGKIQYNMKPKFKKNYASAKEEIEASSLASFGRLLDELDALGMAEYDLWDASEAYWEAQYGVEPAVAVTTIWSNEAETPVKLNPDFEMLSRGDNNKGVVELQELLLEKGFMQGDTDYSYGRLTAEAVKRAQKYYGMIVTGSADRKLVDMLSGAAQPEEAEAAQVQGESYRVDGLAEVRVDRFWFAKAVQTSKLGSGAERSGVNSDNCLLIVDGWVKNLSISELNFYWQITGKLVYDGVYEYPLTVLCERDGGLQFDTSMIPLADSRMVLYAEIPSSIAHDTEKEWKVVLNVGDAAQEYLLAVEE